MALQNGYIDSMGGLPVPVGQLSGGADDGFRRTRLVGHYDVGRDFLIDNRTFEGRPGYVVVSPFSDQRGARYLVNRGWLAAAGSRDVLPDVPTPRGSVAVTAVVWPDTGLLPLLGDEGPGAGWPRRVQRLNVPRLAALADVDYPNVLRLEPGQPGALTEMPVAMAFSPDRHRGYAFQWGALAMLGLVGWVVFGVHRAQAGEQR